MIRFFCEKRVPRKKTLLQFSGKVCRAVPALKNRGEICLIFVSDRKIRQINKKFLQKDKNTDVISFRYPGRKNGRPVPFGDIYISMDTAARQAQQGGHSLLQETALLILHGLLHLAGYEDETLKQRKSMFKKQSELFAKTDPELCPPDFR